MRAEKASKIFGECKNCTEAVLLVFAEKTEMDENTIKNISTGFQVGMFSGETCGAVVGAIMVIGLVKSNSDSIRVINKANVGRMTKKFQNEFNKKYTAINCNEARKLSKDKCNDIVEDAVKILEKII